MEPLHPIYLAFALLGEPLALQINSSRDCLWGFFGSALRDCHYISGSCLSHCWWLTLHPAVQKESLCMVSRRSLFWIPFSALPLGQQFYYDSCKYWHLPGTCLCVFIPHWKGLMFFFWICLDFFLALFFYPAFLWRARKKENPLCKGFLFFFPGNVNSLHRYSGNFSLFFCCVTQETKRGTLSLQGSKSLYLLLKADLVLFDSLAVLFWQQCTGICLC